MKIPGLDLAVLQGHDGHDLPEVLVQLVEHGHVGVVELKVKDLHVLQELILNDGLQTGNLTFDPWAIDDLGFFYLGDEGDPPLDLPPQDDEGRGLAVLVGQLLELGVDEEVRELLAPGEVGRAEGGVADHNDVVLLAVAPMGKGKKTFLHKLDQS